MKSGVLVPKPRRNRVPALSSRILTTQTVLSFRKDVVPLAPSNPFRNYPCNGGVLTETDMDGKTMRAVRTRRGATEQEFIVAINERLGRKHDKAKVTKWESEEDPIPADVGGLMRLWNLSFKPTGQCVIITCALNKGGVAKSLSSCSLAHVLSCSGARILLVDTDSQANSTALAGVSPSMTAKLADQKRTLYHALIPDPPTPLSEVIRKTKIPNLDILPSSLHLAMAETKLNDGTEESKYRLSKLLDGVRSGYDFIVIDTPPSLGVMTMNALVAADKVLLVVQTEVFAVTGMCNLKVSIAEIRERLNPDLKVLGILPTLYQPRQSQDKDSLLDIYKHAVNDRVFDPVQKSAVYGQATAGYRIVHDVDPGAPGLTSFIQIAEALGVTHGA